MRHVSVEVVKDVVLVAISTKVSIHSILSQLTQRESKQYKDTPKPSII
jgi:hypothetical protein